MKKYVKWIALYLFIFMLFEKYLPMITMTPQELSHSSKVTVFDSILSVSKRILIRLTDQEENEETHEVEESISFEPLSEPFEHKSYIPEFPVHIQILGGAEVDEDFLGKKQHPQYNGIEYKPYNLFKQDLDSLPDVLESTRGQEDCFKDGILHISALDIDLHIPDGYYVYRIPGEYLDVQNDRNITLDFVDEYVFTVREVEEEKLIEDIRFYLDRKHLSNNAIFRGPGYVVWDFRVFQKKYLPVENLFVSMLADTGEYFEKEDYYCQIGRRLWCGPSTVSKDPNKGRFASVYYDAEEIFDVSRPLDFSEEVEAGLLIPEENWPVEEWISIITKSMENHGLITESFFPWHIKRTDGIPSLYPMMYTAESMYKSGPFACFVEDRLVNGLEFTWTVSNPDASPVSEQWQEKYNWALAELTDHMDQYLYPEVGFSFQGVYSKYRSGAWWDLYDRNKLRSHWFIDQVQDRELRASVYASMNAWYDEVELGRIMILLNDTEDGRLFGAYLFQEEYPFAMSLLTLSWDATSEMDLCFLHEYGEKYLFQ